MNEDSLRAALKEESEHITASPLLKERVEARRGGRSAYRVGALAVAAVAIVVVVAVIAYFASRPEQKQGLVGRPTPASTAPHPTPSASVVRSSPAPIRIGSGIDGEEWGSGTVPDGSGKSVSYAHATLVRRSFPGGSVIVPSGWVYSDQTIPSDHDDYLFYDPANPTARFEFTQTGCIGCVTGVGNKFDPAGDPRLELPRHTTSSYLIDGGAAARFREQPWLGYDVDGVVRVTRANGRATGSVTYRVALPASDRSVATRIIDSVKFALPNGPK